MPNQDQNKVQLQSLSQNKNISSTKTQIKKKISLQTYLYIIGTIVILFAIIGYFIFSAFFLKNNQINYKNLKLNEFKTKYNVNQDFTLVSDLNLDTLDSNKLYQSNDTVYQNIKNAAVKLGLSNEAINTNAKVTTYTPDGVNSLSAEKFIKIDEDKNFISVNYVGGVNNQPLKKDDVYNYLKDLLGLPDYETSISTTNIKDDLNYSLQFSATYNGKKIRFNGTDDSYIQVYVTGGKILEIYFYYLPQAFTSDSELRQLSKISNDNLSGKYYYLQVFADSFSTSSNGIEPIVNYPIQINPLKYNDEYLFYKDRSVGILLIPARTVNINYTDDTLQRGSGTLLIVNQQ